MSTRIKRTYNSEARSEQAEQTRKRILVASKELFQSVGFEDVTIEKLAKSANVSAPTIYALFQSKRGILRALMDEALPSEEHAALVQEGKNKPPKERLMIAAKISRRLYDAERAEMEIFQGAAVLAPEFKELEREREARRHQRLEDTVKELFKDKAVAKGLTQSKVLDILWAFTGRDLYRMLVVEQGWSSASYEKWLAELLIKTLIDS